MVYVYLGVCVCGYDMKYCCIETCRPSAILIVFHDKIACLSTCDKVGTIVLEYGFTLH